MHPFDSDQDLAIKAPKVRVKTGSQYEEGSVRNPSTPYWHRSEGQASAHNSQKPQFHFPYPLGIVSVVPEDHRVVSYPVAPLKASRFFVSRGIPFKISLTASA